MDQVDELHTRLGRSDSLADYFRALATIGVVGFESYVRDGHTEFVGSDGYRVVSPPHHEPLDVAADSDRDAFLEHLRQHNDGESSYVEMSAGVAASGVEKWVADTGAMTMTYYDRRGAALLTENVEQDGVSS